MAPWLHGLLVGREGAPDFGGTRSVALLEPLKQLNSSNPTLTLHRRLPLHGEVLPQLADPGQCVDQAGPWLHLALHVPKGFTCSQRQPVRHTDVIFLTFLFYFGI